MIYPCQPVKKVNLNRETSPCTSATDYNFSNCIDNKILEELGCRPFWINNDIGTKYPLCQHPSQYMEHFNITYKVMVLNDVELIKEFGCLKPCTYMQYKVNHPDIFLSFFVLCIKNRHFDFNQLIFVFRLLMNRS